MLIAITPLLCAAGLLRGFTGTSYRAERASDLWKANVAWLRHPGRRTLALGDALHGNRLAYDLAPIKAVVGTARIDFFGYRPGWLLLNDFDYVSRPMPITFGAANTYLRRRNEAFYRAGADSPEFVLAQLDPTTPDLVSLDDGLALGALLDNYEPVTTGGDLLLMRRDPADRMRSAAHRDLLGETSLAIGEKLDLAPFASRWLWLEIELPSSLLGRARSLVLRPAPLRIVLDLDGREKPITRRYVASMGTSGFLVSPYLETSSDLAKAYAHGGADLPSVHTVRLECASEDRRFFARSMRIRVLANDAPASPTRR